jgi:hypothetical protein
MDGHGMLDAALFIHFSSPSKVMLGEEVSLVPQVPSYPRSSLVLRTCLQFPRASSPLTILPLPSQYQSAALLELVYGTDGTLWGFTFYSLIRRPTNLTCRKGFHCERDRKLFPPSPPSLMTRPSTILSWPGTPFGATIIRLETDPPELPMACCNVMFPSSESRSVPAASREPPRPSQSDIRQFTRSGTRLTARPSE